MFCGSAFAAAPFAATGSNTFNVLVDETANIADTFVARAVFQSSVAESATGEDTVSVAASTFGAYIAELAAGLDETAVAASTFGANIAETSVALDDVTVAPSTFGASIAEMVVASDLAYAYMLFVCIISEGSTVLDVATARLLWEVINDSQNASWQTVNAAQSTTWATINDSAPNTWSDTPTLD